MYLAHGDFVKILWRFSDGKKLHFLKNTDEHGKNSHFFKKIACQIMPDLSARCFFYINDLENGSYGFFCCFLRKYDFLKSMMRTVFINICQMPDDFLQTILYIFIYYLYFSKKKKNCSIVFIWHLAL